MHRIFAILAISAFLAAPLAAQVALPGVQIPRVGQVLEPLVGQIERTVEDSTRIATRLARDRLRTIDRLVSRNEDIIERDVRGAPSRRGELLVMDVGPAGLRLATAAGFTIIGQETIADLGLAVTRLRAPPGVALAAAELQLLRLLPQATVSADSLHFQSQATVGSPPVLGLSASATAVGNGNIRSSRVGMIDGAPGAQASVAAVRGFASGAPLPSNHGSAIASLLASTGAGPILVADVYGSDKAGGNALAIARGLGWLVGEGAQVVTISLVGPQNPVLSRAINAAQSKGVVVVAAVGNDGPAAPPAYPASYPGVVAVTAVDGRRRALIEAGRALHLDYAAPGADIRGLDARGRRVKLRGTSFATPLVAARIAQAIGSNRNWRRALDSEAIDLGAKGPDPVYGRGLVCSSCKGP